MVGEEVSIFTVSKRKRVGEAAGESRAVLHKHAYLHIDQSIHDMTKCTPSSFQIKKCMCTSMQLLNFHIYSLNIITISFVNPF